MSYPYVDRSIEPPLLVIESGDRVMPGISTLLEKRQIRPPYALRSPVVWMSVFPPKSLQCCRIVAPFGPPFQSPPRVDGVLLLSPPPLPRSKLGSKFVRVALPPPLLSSIGPHHLVRALRSSMSLSEPGAVDPYTYTSEWKLHLNK